MYVKTIRVGNELLLRLMSGDVRLKAGQWIQLDWCDKPSRWVGLMPSGTVWAVHHPIAMSQFVAMSNTYKRSNSN